MNSSNASRYASWRLVVLAFSPRGRTPPGCHSSAFGNEQTAHLRVIDHSSEMQPRDHRIDVFLALGIGFVKDFCLERLVISWIQSPRDVRIDAGFLVQVLKSFLTRW